MKEEIRRIMKLVQEGKLSPEDAAELIDAFQSSDGEEGEERTETSANGPKDTPPAEDAEAAGTSEPAETNKDPFRGFVDAMEKLGKDVSQSVDWHDVARQVRESSKKGMDALKKGIGNVKEGKVHWGWLSTYETREITLPLSVPKGKVLRIENPCGDIRVTGGAESGQVSAHLKVRGQSEEDARENADAFTLLVEESEHQVLVRQHDAPGIGLDLDIRVAGAAPIEVRSMSGDVTVENTGSSCKIQSQSGDLVLRGLDGLIEVVCQSGDVQIKDSKTPSLSLESKSGDITMARITGNVNARTASGDVNLQESSGKTISVESVSGDVRLDLVEPISGTVNVRTVNGESTVAIADGSDCRVSLSTLRGDVHCDIVLDEEARMEQHITGRLGKGKGTLDVSAVNGNIVMRLREHAATAAG